MTRTIHVGHSPDSDDAFMFYALAEGLIDTGDLAYSHELQDIETLNRRALRGELEVTAVSIHAYAYLADRYALLPSGSSMGDRYGPRLVATTARRRSRDATGKRIAVPGSAHHRLSRAQARGARVRTGRRPVRSDRRRGLERRRRTSDCSFTKASSRTARPAFHSSRTWASGGLSRPVCRCRLVATSSERTLEATL